MTLTTDERGVMLNALMTAEAYEDAGCGCPAKFKDELTLARAVQRLAEENDRMRKAILNLQSDFNENGNMTGSKWKMCEDALTPPGEPTDSSQKEGE